MTSDSLASSAVSKPSSAAPVDDEARIASLDVLRGFAVLGILVMNIQAFAMIGSAYINPTAYGDLTGANYWVWVASHVLADLKFISLFSMLFGAGVVLFAQRIEKSGGRPAPLHYRRMGWLVLFGLLHAHLLWSGDILYTYGICGMLVYLVRKRSPPTLFILAVLLLAIGSAISWGIGRSLQSAPDAALARLADEFWQPEPATVAQELQAYRGGWLRQMPTRSEESLFFETTLFVTMYFWRAAALMLIGMALFKLGILEGARSTRFYLGLVALAVLVGIPIIAYGVDQNFKAGWSLRYSFFFGPGSQYNYWGSVLVALGWVGVVLLATRWAALDRATRRLGAVGRMAFTNYILETLICTTIFYGHGLGLFGRVERVGQMLIVVGVWVVLLLVSPIWLRYCRFGPLEWVWRSLTYWRVQPMRPTLSAFICGRARALEAQSKSRQAR
jgi:uncharacterized protein